MVKQNRLIMNKNKVREYSFIDIEGSIYKISCDWVLGFFEGDGTFIIQLKPNKSHRLGYQLILKFEVYQSGIDKNILEAVRVYLNCGKVVLSQKDINSSRTVYKYSITDLKSIRNKLYPLLKNCSMITSKKYNDLKIFLAVLNIKYPVLDKDYCPNKTIQNNKLTINEIDLKKILELRDKLSSKLNKLDLPIVSSNPSPDWIVAFTDAEGNFYVKINKSSKLKYRIITCFSISQEKS